MSPGVSLDTLIPTRGSFTPLRPFRKVVLAVCCLLRRDHKGDKLIHEICTNQRQRLSFLYGKERKKDVVPGLDVVT